MEKNWSLNNLPTYWKYVEFFTLIMGLRSIELLKIYMFIKFFIIASQIHNKISCTTDLYNPIQCLQTISINSMLWHFLNWVWTFISISMWFVRVNPHAKPIFLEGDNFSALTIFCQLPFCLILYCCNRGARECRISIEYLYT